MKETKPRPIRGFRVLDALIPGFIKLLPNYYSRANRCKFAIGSKIYFQVSDTEVIRRFEFKTFEQREVFVDAWKALYNPDKH